MKKNFKIINFKKVDSTNNIAKKLAVNGENESLVVVADSQTAGRGRLGRTFLSEKGGVYFSVILRPNIKAEDTIFITVAAAVAVARAIEKIQNKKCDIKWVNDIYIEGKKVCGILTEGAFKSDGTPDYVILGIGVNLFEPKGGFPQNLPLAGSIFEKKSIFRKNKIKKLLLKEILVEFFEIYNNFSNKDYIKEYQKRSFLTGKKITYKKDDILLSAEVVGIDDNARLIIKKDNDIQTLSQGEIQIVGMEQLEI